MTQSNQTTDRFPVFSAVLAVLIFGMCLSAFSALSAQENRNNEDIARLWLERAASLAAEMDGLNSEREQIKKALAMASEFQTPNSSSDALYLQALLLSSEETPGPDSAVNQALKLAGESLEKAAGGDIVPFNDKAVLWSSLALRLKQYRSILDRYEQWPRGHRYEPVLLYAAARAALYLGLEKQAAELARAGESLADHSDSFENLSPAFNGSAVARFRALAVAAGDRESMETLPSARRWGVSLDNALLPWVLSGYIGNEAAPSLAGTPAGEVLSCLNSAGRGGESVPSAVQDDLAFLRRAGAAVPLSGSYSGTMRADADYDGYPEETARFENGELRQRLIDADQDGLYDWVIVFENGQPIQIVLDAGTRTVNYAGGAYPEVLSMTRKEENHYFEASFKPGAYTWKPLEYGMWMDVPQKPANDEERFWRGIRVVRVKQNFPGKQRTVSAMSRLLDGFILFAREECFAPESPEPLWVREILYEKGLPVAGRRSFRRSSADRRLWELYERYENGKLVGLAWDPGMQGSPVYLKDWALERYMETQVWNMDRNFWMDARRFIMPDGTDLSRKLLVTEASLEDLLPWKAADWAPWDK